MKKTRIRFILAQSLNILAYLLIIIATFIFQTMSTIGLIFFLERAMDSV